MVKDYLIGELTIWGRLTSRPSPAFQVCQPQHLLHLWTELLGHVAVSSAIVTNGFIMKRWEEWRTERCLPCGERLHHVSVDTHSLYSCLRLCWGLWARQLLRTMLVSVAQAVARDQIDLCALFFGFASCRSLSLAASSPWPQLRAMVTHFNQHHCIVQNPGGEQSQDTSPYEGDTVTHQNTEPKSMWNQNEGRRCRKGKKARQEGPANHDTSLYRHCPSPCPRDILSYRQLWPAQQHNFLSSLLLPVDL